MVTADGRDVKVSNGVKIQDVARLATVSPSTVSNVLNGRDERMRPETKERVLHAIEQLSYTPSQVARQLKTGQVKIIGLIVPSVANPFWGMVARDVESVALTYGYQVLLCNAERNPVRERHYAESLWASGVRGVIFGSSPISFEHLAPLAKRGLLVVAFDRQAQSADQVVASSVGVDNVLGGRLAAEHLISLGHRHIGFLSGPIRTVSRRDRLDGHFTALVEAGIEPDPGLIWEGSSISAYGDIEGADLGRIGARALLDRPYRPTAICAINDMYALGAYAGASDLGLRVPDDVSIVGFDDISIAAVAQPALTTVKQPLSAMMQAVVTSLISRLEGVQTIPAEHIIVPPELIIRSSTTEFLLELSSFTDVLPIVQAAPHRSKR